MTIKESVQQENVTFVNMYAHKYAKQIVTDLKPEIHSYTIIVGNFNTPLSAMNRSSR